MTTNIIIAQQGGSSYTIAGEANYDAVGRAVIVTTLGGASGALTLMFWGYFDERHWSMGWIINGLLAGMVRWGCIVLCRIVSHCVGSCVYHKSLNCCCTFRLLQSIGFDLFRCQCLGTMGCANLRMLRCHWMPIANHAV